MAPPIDPFSETPEDRNDPFSEPAPPLSSDHQDRDPFEGAQPTPSDPFADEPPDIATGSVLGRRQVYVLLAMLVLFSCAIGLTVLLSHEAPEHEASTVYESAQGRDATSSTLAETRTTPLESEATTVTKTDPPTTTSASVNSTTSAAVAESEWLSGCDAGAGNDPHGLIKVTESIDRMSFCGEETWQVFVCSTRAADRADRVSYIDDVLGEAAEWFDWASGGQYDIDFSAGDGTNQVTSIGDGPRRCFEEALNTEWSESRSGAVVLVDEEALDPYDEYAGVGTCGVAGDAGNQFGESLRMVAIAVHASGSQSAIAVHELGHAQCWSHSYSGVTNSEYDNPADVMSFPGYWPLGTLAVNRYASGWLHPDQVRVHSESSGAYVLVPCCSGGVQMLALLAGDAATHSNDFNRQWWHLEVRNPEDPWERGLATAGIGQRLGVSIHWIDQNLGIGINRRIAQVADETGDWGGITLPFGALLAAGSEICLRSDQPTSLADCGGAYDWRIEVDAALNSELKVTVSQEG